MTEFSKKTGDYPSLSATDIKVLALTYQLELEHVGSKHLKKEPEVKVHNIFYNNVLQMSQKKCRIVFMFSDLEKCKKNKFL